jgi:hypothetical protein
MPVVLIRHAHAGDRRAWSGDEVDHTRFVQATYVPPRSAPATAAALVLDDGPSGKNVNDG